MDDKVYVWTPLHKSHKYEKAGKYHILDMGILFLKKCSVCGDVMARVERLKSDRIRVGGLFRR